MRRVLLDIVLPVLLARKLHHKRVRVTCLLPRQPAAESMPRHGISISQKLQKKGGGTEHTLHAWAKKEKNE